MFGAVGVWRWRVRRFRLSAVFGAVGVWRWRVRWFRLSAVFGAVRVWCRFFGPFARGGFVCPPCLVLVLVLRVGVGGPACAAVSFFSVPRVCRPRPKIRKFARKN